MILYASKNAITNRTQSDMTAALVTLDCFVSASRIAYRTMKRNDRQHTNPPLSRSITHRLCAPEPSKLSSFHSGVCTPYPNRGDSLIRSTAFAQMTVRLLKVVSLLRVFSTKEVAHLICSMSLPYHTMKMNISM